jgi:hypothetical protein
VCLGFWLVVERDLVDGANVDSLPGASLSCTRRFSRFGLRILKKMECYHGWKIHITFGCDLSLA